MEAFFDEYLSFQNNHNQHSAIRQFCPARMELEQRESNEWQSEMLLDDEMDISWTHFVTENHQPEVEEIVDEFFNLECYVKDNADKSSKEVENEPFDPFPDGSPPDFSIVDNVCYISDVPIMIDDHDDYDFEACSSTADLDFYTPMEKNPISTTIGVDQGLQLVHLLLGCAEAVGCRDTQLANSVLSQIWPCVSPFGDSLRRVSYCFAMGLKSRLSLLQNVNPNGSFSRVASDVSLISREEKSEAFNFLHQTTPYIAFGFTAANDAIFQAALGKDTLHIVDLGMEHNLQWCSLLRSLASRTEGPPKLIRITGIIGDQDSLDLENGSKGLVEEAFYHGIYLEFHFLQEPVSTLSLTREKLALREGEALFVNSVMHLHKHVKESRGSLKMILQSIKKLSPVLLTVVEQDANHNGPFFLGRFLESLHYYSAIFDSIEASLPQNSSERLKIEKFHCAEEIRNVVAYEGSDRTERHERADQWRRQLGRAGFQVVGLKSLGKVKSMVCGYGCDGYTVASEKGCLQLGWKGRPIMLASAWQVNNVSSF